MRYFGLSLLFVFGILQAQGVVQSPAPQSVQGSASSIEQGAMSKPYAEFLFGTQNLSNLNVEILSQKELEETQGEFFGKWLNKWILSFANGFPKVCCFVSRPIK